MAGRPTKRQVTKRIPPVRGALALGAAAVAAVVAVVFGASVTARAADPITTGSGMDTHLFRPAMDSKGLFATNGTEILGSNDISFGLILDYGDVLLRVNNPTQSSHQYINDSFQGTFQFNYGLKNWLVLGLDLPVTLMTGDAASDVANGTTAGNGWSGQQLSAQNLEFLALHAKVRLLRVERGFGIALGIQAGGAVTDAPQQAGAEPGFFYWPQFMLEKRFGTRGQLKLEVDGGFRGHTGSGTTLELRNGEYKDGNLLTYGGGAALRILPAVDLVAETYGTYLTASGATSAVRPSNEVVGGIKVFIERNSYFMLGAGPRYTAGFETANIRAFVGFIFEPSIGDRDGDGIKDDVDKCPDEPEDYDGFQDADGCPDPDNDNDGILDVDDRCPNEPEDRDGDQDADGCPEACDGDRDGDGILD